MADRSKFKATKVNKLKQQEQKAQDTTSFTGGKYPERFKVKDGKTKYRLMPAHPDSPDDIKSYFQQCTVHFLPYYKEEKKDGETKKVLTKRSIFNSRIHGGTKKDIVDEYIKLAYKALGEQYTDKDELAKKLAAIKGYKDKDKKWISGILSASTWEFYALELTDASDPEEFDSFKFGQLSFNSTCRNKLNEILEEEAANDAMGTDPFTDPDTGIPITRKYDKEKSGADAYSILIGRKEKEFPLSSEVLDKLQETTSLEERYVDSYKRSDFEKAYESLELFDELNEYGIFDLEEWGVTVEEVGAYYPAEEEEEDKKGKGKDKKVEKAVDKSSTKPKATTKAVKEEEEDEEEEETEEEEESDDEDIDFSDMTRKELKQFIIDKELSIKVLPSMTDEILVERIQLALENQKLPFKEDDDEKVEKETQKPVTGKRTSRRGL